VQNTWRRAGATYGAIGQIVLLTIVAGLLAAAITLPAVAITGLATRDAANTFDRLPVSTLGDPPAISTMYDVEGKPIARFYPGDIYRVPVTYDQIAPVMRDAIVAIEDSSFYTQGALDPRGTARALLGRAFAVLAARGETSVIAVADDASVVYGSLLTRLGARRYGGSVELIRPHAADVVAR